MIVIEHTSLVERLAFGRAFIKAVHRQLAYAAVTHIISEFVTGYIVSNSEEE